MYSILSPPSHLSTPTHAFELPLSSSPRVWWQWEQNHVKESQQQHTTRVNVRRTKEAMETLFSSSSDEDISIDSDTEIQTSVDFKPRQHNYKILPVIKVNIFHPQL